MDIKLIELVGGLVFKLLGLNAERKKEVAAYLDNIAQLINRSVLASKKEPRPMNCRATSPKRAISHVASHPLPLTCCSKRSGASSATNWTGRLTPKNDYLVAPAKRERCSFPLAWRSGGQLPRGRCYSSGERDKIRLTACLTSASTRTRTGVAYAALVLAG
jgi:hypothetical protein